MFPDHGSLLQPAHAWLRDFRDSSPQNHATFEALFTGPDEHLHYRRRQEDAAGAREHAKVALDYYESRLRDGIRGKCKFSDGILASLLGQLSPHLKVIGHPYDDLLRALRYALTGEVSVAHVSLDKAATEAHVLENRTGLHLHLGKPMKEVGIVLALALGTAVIVDRAGRRLPWAAQAALKAAGAYPFFCHLIRGELVHAVAHLGDGKHLNELVQQLLVSALILAGLVKRDGAHEMAAGTLMASILATVGHIQTNAAVRSLGALRKSVEDLPQTVQVVHGDHVHTHPVNDAVPGETMVAFKKGDVLPLDVTLTSISDSHASVLADTHRSRGQMAQRYSVGDRLDQGTVILEDVTIQARVEANFQESTLSQQVAAQRDYKPSTRQSLAKKVGDTWVWGTVAGTVLIAVGSVIGNLCKGRGVDLRTVLRRATSFATLSSPCSILLSTMVEGTTTRRLAAEGLIPLRGDAITSASAVKTYCLDFTGTCSMGAEFAGATFFDEEGNQVASEEATQLLATATAVGMSASSQHPKQKAMRRALFERVAPEHAQALATRVLSAHEELGQGLRGELDGQAVRVGKLDYVLSGLEPTPSQARVLEESTAEPEHSRTYVRVGGHLGVLRFTDRLRPGAREAIAALGAQNVRILTGDNNRPFILEHTRVLGIDDAHVLTGLGPDDKANQILELKKRGKVAMVGDGLNDAAPMRAADVRYAMADTAHDGILNSVDFLAPSLASIAPVMKVSRRVNLTSFATLAFSILYTGATAALEALGIIKLPVIAAALAHEGVSGAIALIHDRLGGEFVRTYAKERDYLFSPEVIG